MTIKIFGLEHSSLILSEWKKLFFKFFILNDLFDTIISELKLDFEVVIDTSRVVYIIFYFYNINTVSV